MLNRSERPIDLIKAVRRHFGGSPQLFPTLHETFRPLDLPNLQVAVDAYLSDNANRSGQRIGISNVTAASLSEPHPYNPRWRPKSTSLQFRTLHLGDASVSVLQHGLYLVEQPEGRLMFSVHDNIGSGSGLDYHIEHALGIDVHVVAERIETCERFLAELRDLMNTHSVYRGRCLSFAKDEHGDGIRFHQLPEVTDENIILPDGLLDRINRTTIEFSAHAEKLREWGRHLKRGVLFYGPPGTGKTLTAMYLASRMKDRTVLLVTGECLGMLDRLCGFARLLQPATLVVEDIDLIAEERTNSAPGCQPLLFDLLNQMDGIGPDTDVLFLLTTNRADLLEPALASRPGRIDQAFEIPLPDLDCRRRLMALYKQGMRVELEDEESLARRTEGVSAAFIREWFRRGALLASVAGLETIGQAQMEEALHELVYAGGELTRNLLGAQKIGLR